MLNLISWVVYGVPFLKNPLMADNDDVIWYLFLALLVLTFWLMLIMCLFLLWRAWFGEMSVLLV